MNELFRQLLGLPDQASTFAERIDTLNYQIFTGTIVTFLGVFGAMMSAEIVNDGPVTLIVRTPGAGMSAAR